VIFDKSPPLHNTIEKGENMFSEKIIRWSGLALALGGLIAALFWILHPEESLLLTDPAAYQTEHILDVAGLMLLTPGLIGLYARLVNRTGWLGLTGFLTTLLPLLVMMGISVVDLLIWPSIAQIQPDLILTPEGEFTQTSGPFAATISLIVPFAMIGALGFSLFGVAIWRSRMLPRGAGLLLAIAGPLYLVGPGFIPHGVLLLNLLVYGPFAAAAIWLGKGLLSGPEPQPQSIPVGAEPAL
jgi:hypothetical protein